MRKRDYDGTRVERGWRVEERGSQPVDFICTRRESDSAAPLPVAICRVQPPHIYMRVSM
jgi:hypothetical protein